MTVFSSIASAMIRTVGEKPLSAYTEARGVAMEMAELANDVARDIISVQEWSELQTSATLVSDGGDGYPLPVDYDRMPIDTVLGPAGTWDKFLAVRSRGEWDDMLTRGFVPMYGAWIMYGGRIHFNPAAQSDVLMPYLSKNYALSSEGVPKPQFDADTDTFRLDERILTLGLIWRWKAQKGLEYAEDMTTYELELSRQMARDGGPRILLQNYRPRFNGNIAYPYGRRF